MVGDKSMMKEKKMFNVSPFALLMVAIVLWASAFTGVRLALPDYEPGHIALLRFLVASAIMGSYAVAARMRLPQKKDLPGIFALGFFGFTGYNIGLCTGEKEVLAGVASLLVASVPIFTALLATTLFKERLKPVGWLGVIIGFCGVTLIALGQEGEGFRVSYHALFIVLAALSLSIYFVFQKPFHGKYSVLELTTYTVLAGTLFLLVFLPGLSSAIRSATWEATSAVVYLGIFPTIVSFLTWNKALTRIPASVAASFIYFSPAIALTIAWVFLGEVPRMLSLFGGIVIITGVVIVNTRGRNPRNN